MTHVSSFAATLPSAVALARSEPRDLPAVLRFTVDGSPALEEHLAQTCARIAAGVRGLIPAGRLEALLLGGGYGRGEGGVLRTPAGDRPYNDLEFYVGVRGNRHLNEQRFGRALHVLGEILTPQAGVEVEFRITSLDELARQPVSMFSYDLVRGHRWLVGGEDLLARCAHHRDAALIPLHEATRLLMNRCSGLLFARERLQKREFTAGDADFVRRNIAKAQLALGDAVLVAAGQYHWSVRERGRRMKRVPATPATPWLAAACRHHAAGVDFKLHPERSTASREELLAQHTAVTALARDVWFWVEGRRLHTRFGSPREYALSAIDKFPDLPSWRNVLVTAKTLGPRSLLGSRALRHPRERILNVLALLLWQPNTLADPELLAHAQALMRTKATTFAGIVRAYHALWARVN